MLALDIAIGVAGGVLIILAGSEVLKAPNRIANRRQKDRHHREFIESMIEVAERAETAAKEAMEKKPRRKPATKKAPAKKKTVTAPKKGATNVKPKTRR